MTNLLNESIQTQIREVFEKLQSPVNILYFGKSADCEHCEDTHNLVEEVSNLSEKIEVTVYDLDKETETAKKHGVDKAPALVITTQEGDQSVDHGVRFAGIPSGYEFSSFINAVLLASNHTTGLKAETRRFLKELDKPVRLQVFTTPTCPYCPRAVNLAHQMAFESDMVEAEMIEAIEFPDLAMKYQVSGVPHTVINDGNGSLIGAVPEEALIDEIKQALAES